MCVAFVLFLGVVAQSPHDDPAAIVRSLESATQQWQRETSFRSSFELRHGFANSIAEGLRTGVDSKITGPPSEVFEARGLFHKKGPLLRYSLIFTHAPVSINSPVGLGAETVRGGKGLHTNVSFEEVTNGEIQVRYHPGASGNDAHVGKRSPGALGVGQCSADCISPCSPYGNSRFRPFELWPLDAEFGPGQVQQKIFTADDDHVEVVLHHEGKWKQSRRLRFWTAPALPVLTQIDGTVTDPSGGVYEEHMRLSSFRECPGGMVAQKVRVVFKPVGGKAFVRDWTSNDLGDVPPSDNDFAVSIAADTGVGGLAKPPAAGEPNRVIDITKITEADLGSGPILSARSKKRSTSGRAWTSLWVSTGLLALAVGILVIRFYRRRRPHTKPAQSV